MAKKEYKSRLQELVANKKVNEYTQPQNDELTNAKKKALDRIREYLNDATKEANVELSPTGSTLTIITSEKTPELDNEDNFIQIFLTKNENQSFGKSPYLLIEPDDKNPELIRIKDRFFEKNDRNIEISKVNEEVFENAMLNFISDNLK